MKILVIGSGGREHALVWKLAQSATTTQLWWPHRERRNRWGKARCKRQASREYRYWRRALSGYWLSQKANQPDLTVVGPDNPLSMGVVDLFQANGFTIWGPNLTAQFEASKAFPQTFTWKPMVFRRQPARGFFRGGGCGNLQEALGGCCAVKADGLALGKGVLITSNEEEADQGH